MISKNGIFIIAEMAQSYEGIPDIAKELAEKASLTGADGVMFQLVFADELALPENKLYDTFKRSEMPRDVWSELVHNIQKNNSYAIAEVFGDQSLEIAIESNVDGLRIHASDINNYHLIKNIANTKLPIFLSIGGSYPNEIKNAISLIQKYSSPNTEVTLMHGYQRCPTPPWDSHMSKISELINYFDLPIGYSDHSAGFLDKIENKNPYTNDLCILAIGMGCRVVEKHIMPNRSKWWIDHESALTPDEFALFVKQINSIYSALGSQSMEFNSAEEIYRKTSKKCIAAAYNIKSNTIITEDKLMFIRPENPDESIINPNEVIGKKCFTGLSKRQIIQYKNIVEVNK